MAITVKVEIPPKLLGLHNEIQRRESRLYAAAAEGMRDEVARVAPGGAGGKIGRSFRAVGNTVVSASPAAHALDVGAYITPTARTTASGRPPVLRFSTPDGTIFRPYSRLKPKHYVRKALTQRKGVLARAFQRVYGDLLG